MPVVDLRLYSKSYIDHLTLGPRWGIIVKCKCDMHVPYPSGPRQLRRNRTVNDSRGSTHSTEHPTQHYQRNTSKRSGVGIGKGLPVKMAFSNCAFSRFAPAHHTIGPMYSSHKHMRYVACDSGCMVAAGRPHRQSWRNIHLYLSCQRS